MAKKKILIFSLSYYPRFVGGAEIAIKEITDRISSKEIEFHILTLRFDNNLPKQEKIGNVLVHRIGFTKKNPTISDLKKFPLFLNKVFFQFGAFWYARKLHKKNKYDAVWAMMAHSTGIPAGLFKTFNKKIPYILTLQEGDPIPYIKKKMWPVYSLFKRAFTKADTVQAISNYLGSWAREMKFKGSLEIIPNGVAIKHFSQEYSENELRELKNSLGKKENDVFLITTSRLVKKNAIDDVIKSLKKLPENTKFLVLGDGPDKEKLEKLVSDFGLQKRVLFLGNIDHFELPKYLKISDIFIRPSLSEGMGNSFIEAMVVGLPVIATQEGGIADFLFDEKRNPNKETTGWTVDVKSPEQIAEVVKDILANPEKVKKVKESAYNMVLKKYDWNLIAEKMQKEVFEKVLYKK